MSDAEGIGDAVAGGVIAVETADGHTHERNCLNCGCALIGEFCHCCGQHAHVHRTIGAWWHDFLHSVLHIDGKFWRTLAMLAWRPGELTRRYAHGERRKFISPLALFLFTVFLMFAVFSLIGGPVQFSRGGEQAASAVEIRDERAEALAEIRKLEQELERLRARGEPTASAERQLRLTRTAFNLIEGIPTTPPNEQRSDTQQEIASGTTAGGARGVVTLNLTGIGPLDRALTRARENPELLLYKLQANAFKFSWALIPISVPFVWLLFLHRRRYRREFAGYDHLVFATYSIAFMTLWASSLSMFRALGFDETAIVIALFVLPPLHIHRQLSGAYGLGRASALWRTFALLFFALIALTMFVSLAMTLGVLG